MDMVARIVTEFDIDSKWLLTGEPSSGNNPVTASGGSVAVGGNNNSSVVVGADASLFQERIKHLEDLLAEKEG